MRDFEYEHNTNRENPTHFSLSALRGGRIKRYHTAETVRQQTVAEHSFNVMVLVDVVCQGMPGPNLLRAVMYHDISEQLTGDIPAPGKWLVSELAVGCELAEDWYEDYYKKFIHPNASHRVTKEEAQILRYCDMLELLINVYLEEQLGNKTIGHIKEFAIEYLDQLTAPNKIAKEIYNNIKAAIEHKEDLFSNSALEYTGRYLRQRSSLSGHVPGKMRESSNIHPNANNKETS